MNQKEQDIKRILKYIESEDLDVITVAQIAFVFLLFCMNYI